MKVGFVLMLVMFLMLLSSNLFAEGSDKKNFAIGAKGGTLGLGLDLTYGINDRLNTRLNVNRGSIDADGSEDGIDYIGDIEVQTVGGIIDYHPTGGGFRVSAGVYKNNSEVNLSARSDASNSSVEIGNTQYDISNASINTNIGFNTIAPYLGVGWGNPLKIGRNWHFNADVGALFQGAPKAKISSSGAVSLANGEVSVDLNDPLFQDDIAREEDNLNDELNDFKIYPVIALGVSYRF